MPPIVLRVWKSRRARPHGNWQKWSLLRPLRFFSKLFISESYDDISFGLHNFLTFLQEAYKKAKVELKGGAERQFSAYKYRSAWRLQTH